MNSHPPLPGVQFSLDRADLHPGAVPQDLRGLIQELLTDGWVRVPSPIGLCFSSSRRGMEIFWVRGRQQLFVTTPTSYLSMQSVNSLQEAIDIITAVTGCCAHLSTTAKLVVALQEERRLAETDTLTGLLSRRGLERLWGLYRDRWYGVCVIDIDKFKSVNDTYGHAVGDDLLRRIGHAMNKAAPALVGRLGGDEFCALIPVSNSATHLPGALVEAVEVTPVRPEHVHGLSASMGFSFVADEMSLWDAVATADREMYRDKRGAQPSRRTLRRQYRDAPPAQESAWIV